MSKNKGNKDRHSNGSTPPASSNGAKKSREVKSFIERMCDKATVCLTRATEIAGGLEKRGAPMSTVAAAKEFVKQTEILGGAVVALKDARWEPAKKSVASKIGEKDKVAIKPEFRAKYSYIAGVVEGTAIFIADKLVPRGKGSEVLLRNAEGHAFGYVPNTQLDVVESAPAAAAPDAAV